MNNSTKKENIYKLLFIAGDDPIFNAVTHLTRYDLIKKASLEILFFSNKSHSDFNALSFCELLNEQIKYSNEWLTDLYVVSDNESWKTHRDKITSRFSRLNMVSQKECSYLKSWKAIEQDKDVINIISNVENYINLWNNVIIEMNDGKYSTKLYSSESWTYWQMIQNYFKDESSKNIIILKNTKININKIESKTKINIKKNENFKYLINEYGSIISQFFQDMVRTANASALLNNLSAKCDNKTTVKKL